MVGCRAGLSLASLASSASFARARNVLFSAGGGAKFAVTGGLLDFNFSHFGCVYFIRCSMQFWSWSFDCLHKNVNRISGGFDSAGLQLENLRGLRIGACVALQNRSEERRVGK